MHQFDKLSKLVTELCFPMNPDKISPFDRTLTCLGITIDLDNYSLSIEQTKLKEIYAESLEVRSKSTLTRRKFQSLHKCIRLARIFINKILSVFC